MKLVNQVCTLNQAVKLKELGVIQESEFFWKTNDIQTNVTTLATKEMISKYLPSCNRYYSAYSAAELIVLCEGWDGINYSKSRKDYYNDSDFKNLIRYKTFSEALAAKLIDGIVRGWINIEKMNQRYLNI